jgi:hypothetical protein
MCFDALRMTFDAGPATVTKRHLAWSGNVYRGSAVVIRAAEVAARE